MKNLVLPAPGTAEPEGKPSRDRVRLGDKPVLPPPARDLTQEAVENAAKQAAAAAAAASEIPLMTEAPPPDLRVEREAQRPQPMKRERSKSKSVKVKIKQGAAKKGRHTPELFDDSEVAVVARDPRRPREE